MSNSHPLVSVIVPSYNAAGWLPGLCRSLQAQTFRDFEVLIGDDGSTDNTREVLAPFLADARFQIISWKPNRGMTAGWLTLLERVRGEFYCTMAADDEWEPTFLECRLAVMQEHPQVVLAHGRTRLIDESGQPLGDRPEYVEQTALHRGLYDRLDRLPAILSGAEALPLLLQHNVIGATSLMIRTAASRRLGNHLRFGWIYATDWSHWLLHLAADGDLAYDARPLALYRVHGGSLTCSPSKEAMRDSERRLVPLWALGTAAKFSMYAGDLWTRWRGPLYGLWLRRAAKLARAGQLNDAWLQAGALAFYGPGRSRVNLWTELARHSVGLGLHTMREAAARRRQFCVVSGLALIEHPFYRGTAE